MPSNPQIATIGYADPVTGRRWRLAELARLAGVSEQQVRNYVDTGVLPPVTRAANNYRVFTDQHADALRTARTLASGHGWPCARAVLGAVHAGDIPGALAMIDDSHADLARERATIAAATRAFTEAAGDPAPSTRRPALIGQVATDIGVRTPVLRLWEQRGLLLPRRDPVTGYRVFDPAEQRAAHLVAVLRRGDFAFGIIEAVIDTLRTSGSMTRALTELARRDQQVYQHSRQRLRATAALHVYLDKHYWTPQQD
jgi:DNA-binding transcriptional MerR regulator